MRVVILGSGTSSGVPMIGCSCPVCQSAHPRNRRTRASAAVDVRGMTLLLDTATDLREQAIRCGLQRVDAVLYTHAHADHIHGIDELRVFNLRQLSEIPCFGNRDIAERIRQYFRYVFDAPDQESFRPFLAINEVDGPFYAVGVPVVPIPLLHGELPVLGYRIGAFAYLTDVSRVPETSLGLLAGLELMVVDALRTKPHATHFSIQQAAELALSVRARRAVLTHLSHLVDYETTNVELPKGVELAYDGMSFDLGDPEERRQSC